MGTLADEPLTKTTLFLYAKDIETLRRRYGYGWSTRIRELVRDHLRRGKAEDIGNA